VKLVFLNRFYWPEEPASGQLLTDLAEALVVSGHQVIVIASRGGDSAFPAREICHGVHIHRVRTTRWSTTGVLAKSIDYFSFHVRVLSRLARIATRDTIVVAMTDPPLLGIGAWLVARLKRARLVHWVQDIYPEIAVELTGHRWLASLRPLRDLAWRRADACVTLGSDMGSVLREAGVRAEALHLISNRAPAGLTPQPDSSQSSLRTVWGLGDTFIVAYSGNLGRVHELEPVLGVAHLLREDREIAFVFIGEGPQRDSLEQAARTRALANVHFQPPQPRSRLNETLGLANLHLVTLRDGCERYVFPSKFQGAVAVGRPVLFIGPTNCELARIVRNHQMGATFAPTESAAIAEFIRSLARDPAAVTALGAATRRYAADLASPDATLHAWEMVFAGMKA
jgi:colanic acid biosynthesis glycosyl transferase WcaI